MTQRKKTGRRRPSRLERIERKCDRILAEMLVMRQRRISPLDDAIERMHEAARMMRARCAGEYDEACGHVRGRR